MKQGTLIGWAGLCVLCVSIIILSGLVSGQPDRSDATRIAPKDDNIPQAVADGSILDEAPKNLLAEFDKKGHGVLENATPNATPADGTVRLRAQFNGSAGYQARYQDKINRLYAANGLPSPVIPAVATDPSETRRLKEIWAEANLRRNRNHASRPITTARTETARRPSETNRRLTASGRKPHVAENGSYYGQISKTTGRPKTVAVRGYYRKNGTYVRGHYRSRPRR